MENYGQLIMDRVSVLKQIPDGMLQQLSVANIVTGGLPYMDLLSSLTPFQDCTIICDSGTNVSIDELFCCLTHHLLLVYLALTLLLKLDRWF